MRDKWLLGVIGAFVVALLLNVVALKTLTGIPAHPLLLHIPVVLIPALAAAALVFAVKPDWRRTYGIAYGLGAAATTAGTVLAANAGEQWEEMISAADRLAIHEHAELGDTLKVVVMIFAALVILQVAIDRGALGALGERFRADRSLPAVLLSVAISALAIGAGVLTVATGHEGAKAVFGKERPALAPSTQPFDAD